MEAITEKALTHPKSLTEAHIAYAGQVFGEDEANFINWVYVQEQSKYYSEILRGSGFAGRVLPAPDRKMLEEPSFERNLRARLRELSPEDRCILELYAQIRGGQDVCPGAFTKRTCNIVAELTAEVILALEELAPHV